MTPTNALTQSILKYLNLSGFKVWRNGSHAVWSKKRNAYMKNPTTLLGVSDIIGFNKKSGLFIAVEVKTGKDKLSEYQILFLDDVKASGGIAIVAWTFEQFEEEFKNKTKCKQN